MRLVLAFGARVRERPCRQGGGIHLAGPDFESDLLDRTRELADEAVAGGRAAGIVEAARAVAGGRAADTVEAARAVAGGRAAGIVVAAGAE